MKKRAVISGIGPITPIGTGKEEFWSSLINGKCGAKKIDFQGYDMAQYSSKIACTIDNYSITDYIPKSREMKYYGRTTSFSVVGTKLALIDAGFELITIEEKKNQLSYVIKNLDSQKVGLILGIGAQNMDISEKYHKKLLRYGGPRRISALALPQAQISSVPANVSKKFGIKGTTFCVSTACASSSHALIQALKQIQSGEETMIITGGAEACITPYVFGGFNVLNVMSTRNDEPEKASRPYDKNRDGFVIGEGAGIIVLEELHHALERGADIYCELTGYGCTSDAYHIVAPDPSADMQAEAMVRAVGCGKSRLEEIDYINAQGTSTYVSDITETLAIKKAFRNLAYKIPISATKSMVGHLIGGSGGVEIIATALMIKNGMIHPTANHEIPGDGCDLNYVPQIKIEKKINKALKNSFAFGGLNACILLEKWHDNR